MRILIFVGTGGVGKTSVAAAAGLRAALDGSKSLVLTIDPARRLRSALRLDGPQGQQRVALDPSLGARGELWAAVLDVRAVLDRAVGLYSEPGQAERVLKHPVYHAITSSLAGMQELLAIERLDQAISEGFENIVIDTAPSRHALEFLDKPEFFVQLVSFPFVRLVGRTYKLWARTPFSHLSRKSMELYAKVQSLLGANLVRQVLDFYSVFLTVAESYAERAKKTHRLLRDNRISSFSIVTTPFKAQRDGHYFQEELSRRRFPVQNLVVNRFWPSRSLHLAEEPQPLLTEAVGWYRNVSEAHTRAWQTVQTEFSGRVPNLVCVPELTRDVDGVAALQKIAEHLRGL